MQHPDRVARTASPTGGRVNWFDRLGIALAQAAILQGERAARITRGDRR